jgi:DNA-binding NtrC family response regulator
MDRKVLILDDDQETLELLAAYLKQAVQVSTALNINQALCKLKSDYFDFVICDVRLGTENGFQFIEELQSNLLTIPFVIISADVDEEKRARAKKLGAMAIIEKPFPVELLLETIQKGLDPMRRFHETRTRRLARAA